MQAARIIAANFNGEGVVEAQGRTDCQVKTAGVLTFHPVIDLVGFISRLLLQDRGQSGTGVLGINVNTAGENALLADESPREIEATVDGNVGFGRNMLRQDFPE